MKNKNILKALTGILFVSVLVVGGALSIAPLAHAQEDDGGYDFGTDSGSGCCGDIAPSSIDYGSSDQGSIAPSSIDYTSPYDEGSIAPSSIDYTSPYSDEYSSPSSYSTSGYSASGYTGGSYYSAPTPIVYNTPSTPSNTNTNINNNTCTGNSCNTNITNPAPVINNVVTYPPAYTTPVQTQYCASGYYGTYPNCYLNQQPIVYQTPVAYNATPYVTLTQVPYTGLDLGFWGSIAYWGAMVLFALVVAYLIAIKRVQNVIARSMKNFLFGTADEAEEAPVVADAPAQVAKVAYAPATQTSEDVIDSFILSQVNRPRHA